MDSAPARPGWATRPGWPSVALGGASWCAVNWAQMVDDLKRTISEMRKRKEEERELQENQRHQSALP
jgi:hypothetical protein